LERTTPWFAAASVGEAVAMSSVAGENLGPECPDHGAEIAGGPPFAATRMANKPMAVDRVIAFLIDRESFLACASSRMSANPFARAELADLLLRILAEIG
jgi:hypothetical protein